MNTHLISILVILVVAGLFTILSESRLAEQFYGYNIGMSNDRPYRSVGGYYDTTQDKYAKYYGHPRYFGYPSYWRFDHYYPKYRYHAPEKYMKTFMGCTQNGPLRQNPRELGSDELYGTHPIQKN